MNPKFRNISYISSLHFEFYIFEAFDKYYGHSEIRSGLAEA